jgi:hypothetical protein
MSSTAIQTYEPGAYLTQWREPEEVLAEARKAAIALKQVVSLKKNPVMFGGEQYLEREDWGTVAKFYGCTAKTIETRYVEFGGARGWEAVAVVIDRSMNEIGRAESMCLSDEDQWGEVAKYEWQDELDDNGKKIWVEGPNGKKRPKGKRVQVGTVPKPLFQLRSMAATRAEAKALKGVFSWVVVLAGYQPTPAEEMVGNENFEEQREPKPPVTQPSRASEKKQTQPATQTQGQKPSTQSGVTEISGVIEQAKSNAAGDLWLSLPSGLVKVVPDKIDSDMKQGYFIKLKGEKKTAQGVGDFWLLAALIELSPVQDGTPETKAEPAAEGQMASDASAVAAELFPDTKGNATVDAMVGDGTLKKASDLPETAAKKPGTIGVRRAQRIYTLATQNKKTNNGFNEEEIKKILSALPAPIEHLRDLEVGMQEMFEKWATGEDDFRKFWQD